MIRLFMVFVASLCLVSGASGQLTRGQYQADQNNRNIPQAGIGVWKRADNFKQAITQPQLAWSTPVKITYTAHTGSTVAGETETGSTSGATGILVKDTSTVLMIRPLTGTFLANEQVTGNGGGSFATTTITQSAFEQTTNYVWSAYQNHTGILATNAQGGYRQGGATVSLTYTAKPTMFGTGSGLYALNLGTQAAVTYSTETAPLTLGSTVTQLTTLATGCAYFDNASNTVKIEVISGTFDGNPAHTISDGTHTATPSACTNSSNVNFLEWSPDGWTNFATVTDVSPTSLNSIPTFGGALVDTGVHPASINGHTNSRVVLYFDYGEGNCSVRYCQPDINPYTWTTLINADGTVGTTGAWPYNGSTGADQSIRHFHGAMWVSNTQSPAISATDGRLFVFSGDQDDQCGMYTCDNIADLIANPSTWKSNWGLDCCGPCRVWWFNNTATTQTVSNYTSKVGGFYKGGTALMLRQGSNWASRQGLTDLIREWYLYLSKIYHNILFL